MSTDQGPGGAVVRVLVADNSRIHSRLLADALREDSSLQSIPFELQSSDLVAAALGHNIHVLVVSSTLDEQPSRGLNLLRELRALRPSIRSVALLDSSKDDAVLAAFRAGACGVFAPSEPIELLRKCVRCVYRGEIWANSHHISIALSALASSPSVRAVNADGMSLLSERELSVVQCLVEGLTNREIAARLQLSQHTVKNYLFRVFDKLGVSSRFELLSMTLCRTAPVESLPARPAQVPSPAGDHVDSHDESDMLRKSAEAGLPAAQLALAQLYLNRRRDSREIVEAYMWYLVATERALQAREHVTKMMTPQQIEEAKERACIWLSKRKGPTSSPFASTLPKNPVLGADPM
jgi:two-component system, NarL family, nitrate/nitrite response regulator NarL